MFYTGYKHPSFASPLWIPRRDNGFRNCQLRSSSTKAAHKRECGMVLKSVRSSPVQFQMNPTPLTQIRFRGRKLFIKRDDLLQHVNVSGSKLRKFYSLFLTDSLNNSDFVVSYGGAQSNAMLALSHLCHYYGKMFFYVTRPTSERSLNSPGNLKQAIKAGMHHVQIDLDTFRTFFTDSSPNQIQKHIFNVLRTSGCDLPSTSPLFIPQGGAWPGAEKGISILAAELRDQIDDLRKDGDLLAPKKPIVFLASGTGTTAFYLQKHLQSHAKVVTVPVSGDERYLVKQMRWLDSNENNLNSSNMKTTVFPDILRPRLRSTFADVRKEKLSIWKELSRATDDSIHFDLIYAPKVWEEVLLAIQERRLATGGEDLIYYHSGGVEGNVSMLAQIDFLAPVYIDDQVEGIGPKTWSKQHAARIYFSLLYST